MPSLLHEMLLELFKNRPLMAAELLESALGPRLPPYDTASLEPTDLSECAPTAYHADSVALLTDSQSRAGPLAVVVEIQRGRDKDKHWTWPVYVTTVRARYKCPAALLVLCPDPGVAAWCAQPIDLGPPGSIFRPIVIGPDAIPTITDTEEASRSLEMAVLSALAHSDGPTCEQVIKTTCSALNAANDDRSALYAGFLYAVLPAASRRYLEAFVRTVDWSKVDLPIPPWTDVAIAKAEAKAEARGEAAALLEVLSARGVDVPEDTRAQITNCTDLEQLRQWLRRAATANDVDELFDGATLGGSAG
jgi:hypothetical protein